MNRRARIKGIANIPVRRKVETVKSESSTENNVEKVEETINQETEDVKTTEEQSENHTPNDENGGNNLNLETDTKNTENSSSNIPRRWIPKPKPAVKNLSLIRRPKPTILPLKDKSEVTINQNIENESPKVVSRIPEQIPLPEHQECSENVLKSPDQSPLSSNKILNRSRIRATPKLIRRNSIQGSASESEDDGRRSRIRNDSVCSTTSFTTEIVKENVEVSKDKLFSVKVHKLFRRSGSEQCRKVAEARKDFYSKFGTSIPDRKKLTMMDLIYYNPISNPMPQKKEKSTVEEIPKEPIEVEEQKEDDPEEEDSNPVPQVKIGPNGEIILDEQSLVIEQTGTKKGREKLANSQIIQADDLNRAYGIYKRPKRAKDWTAIETLRFYRSLNTVGTDFSLMVSLFPGRTRRELKIKFKKEEKINRQLIDKALTNPLDFDLSELEKQCAEEEELIKKMEEQKKSKERKPRKKIKKTSASALEMDEEIEEEDPAEKLEIKPKRISKLKKDRYSALNIGGLLSTSESEDSEDDIPRKRRKFGKNSMSKRDKIEPDLTANNNNDIKITEDIDDNTDAQNLEKNSQNNYISDENTQNTQGIENNEIINQNFDKLEQSAENIQNSVEIDLFDDISTENTQVPLEMDQSKITETAVVDNIEISIKNCERFDDVSVKNTQNALETDQNKINETELLQNKEFDQSVPIGDVSAEKIQNIIEIDQFNDISIKNTQNDLQINQNKIISVELPKNVEKSVQNDDVSDENTQNLPEIDQFHIISIENPLEINHNKIIEQRLMENNVTSIKKSDIIEQLVENDDVSAKNTQNLPKIDISVENSLEINQNKITETELMEINETSIKNCDRLEQPVENDDVSAENTQNLPEINQFDNISVDNSPEINKNKINETGLMINNVRSIKNCDRLEQSVENTQKLPEIDISVENSLEIDQNKMIGTELIEINETTIENCARLEQSVQKDEICAENTQKNIAETKFDVSAENTKNSLEINQNKIVETEVIEKMEESDQNCSLPNILPNDLSTVEPGSLMIVSSSNPDGQPVFKVFMVTPGQTKIAVNLSEDIIQSLTNSLGDAQAVTLDLPVINEENME